MTTGQSKPERVAAALDGLRLLRTHGAVARELAARFGMSVRQAREYVAIARRQLAAESAEMRPVLREQVEAALRDTYDEARGVGDRKNALAALDQLRKLFGLDEAERVEVTGQLSVGQMPHNAIRDRLRELAQKHRDVLEGGE